MQNDRIDFTEALNIVAVLCALVITVLLVRRELGQRSVPSIKLSRAEVTQVRQGGHKTSVDNPRTTVVVYEDFECPSCRRFALTALSAVMRQFEDQGVEFVFKHWPLPYHKEARSLALAADCSVGLGDFHAFRRFLYEHQSEVVKNGLPSALARMPIIDQTQMMSCVDSLAGDPPVWDDHLPAALGAKGTPAVIVGNRLFLNVPDSSMLARAIVKNLR